MLSPEIIGSNSVQSLIILKVKFTTSKVAQ